MTSASLRKALKEKLPKEIEKLAPDIHEYWFFWRPVIRDVCTFKEMWIDQLFTFEEISQMHEMLDFQAYMDAYQSPKE